MKKTTYPIEILIDDIIHELEVFDFNSKEARDTVRRRLLLWKDLVDHHWQTAINYNCTERQIKQILGAYKALNK